MPVTCGEVSPVMPRYKWTINNFTIQSTDNDAIHSPFFSTTCLNLKYRWQLYLYPKSEDAEDEDNDNMAIFLYNRGNVDFTASISFSVLNKKNEVVTSSEIDEHQIGKDKSWGLQQFVKISTIKDVVMANNDTLVILCEIIFQNDDGEMPRMKYLTAMDTLRLRELDSQWELMLQGNFSDVTFLIDGKKLHLHKCILAKSSSVLAHLFESEPENRCIAIEDVKYDIFTQLALYAYTAEVQVNEEMAKDLLVAADKYKIDGLKLWIEMALWD